MGLSPSPSTRRDLLKASAVAGVSALATRTAPAGYFTGVDDTIKVGLVGCGGRGTGAAVQALRADQRAKLVAMHDAFGDRLTRSLENIRNVKDVAAQVEVSPDKQFTGFDGYTKLLDSGLDLVVLASPPHFRPMQVEEAVKRRIHMFVEKPIAVDAPGVRRVMAACEQAKELKLNVVSGLCYRYHDGRRALMERIHAGDVGRILTIDVNYLTGELWHRGRQPQWSEMEFQCRNWLYFAWLSGDHIAEQHIHSLDVAAWALGDRYPKRCLATGGRQVRTDPKFGNVYDHFATRYEYEDGVQVFSACRQMAGCTTDVSDNIHGTDGHAFVFKHRIDGKHKWEWDGENSDMYQNEHDALFAALRKGEPINNGDYMCKSTLMAIMGRLSAYTGQAITWEQALNSKEVLAPKEYAWGDVDPALMAIATPGVTKFV
ncbi:MAG: Gfo/Idh/MocA family oxidoreductase [Planctomycetota bacterium]